MPVDDNGSVAAAMQPMLHALLGSPLPLRFEFWDGSVLGEDADKTLSVNSPDALRRIVWSPQTKSLMSNSMFSCRRRRRFSSTNSRCMSARSMASFTSSSATGLVT